MPATTLIYVPYNLYVLQFSYYQLKLWLITGIFYGAFVAMVMTWINIFAVRMTDKYIKRE